MVDYITNAFIAFRAEDQCSSRCIYSFHIFSIKLGFTEMQIEAISFLFTKFTCDA